MPGRHGGQPWRWPTPWMHGGLAITPDGGTDHVEGLRYCRPPAPARARAASIVR